MTAPHSDSSQGISSKTQPKGSKSNQKYLIFSLAAGPVPALTRSSASLYSCCSHLVPLGLPVWKTWVAAKACGPPTPHPCGQGCARLNCVYSERISYCLLVSLQTSLSLSRSSFKPVCS